MVSKRPLLLKRLAIYHAPTPNAAPIVFILFLLFWPALVQADFQAGMDAANRGDYLLLMHKSIKNGQLNQFFVET